MHSQYQRCGRGRWAINGGKIDRFQVFCSTQLGDEEKGDVDEE
jgi:hypothetical protein